MFIGLRAYSDELVEIRLKVIRGAQGLRRASETWLNLVRDFLPPPAFRVLFHLQMEAGSASR